MTEPTGKPIKLRNVHKSWGDTASLNNIDLDIPAGQFTAILGPSGCGKSTTLRIISGLETASRGTVHIGGTDVTRLPPAKRQIAMVFQNYALFPHLSVAENIVFGLRVERLDKHTRQSRLEEVARLLELTPYLDRKPAALSGGQQQRVALGRAVISRRPVCLMDEPLSNLDARLRDEMRREIRRLQQTLGFTMVYVTHDQTEAITMADQVVLMNNGRIEQVATPQTIYQKPETTFAARFIGTPPMNLILGQVLDAPQRVQIGVRPEVLVPSDAGALLCTVKGAEFLGADTLVELDLNGHPVLAKLPGNVALSPGVPIRLGFSADDLHLFEDGRRIEDPTIVTRLSRGAL